MVEEDDAGTGRPGRFQEPQVDSLGGDEEDDGAELVVRLDLPCELPSAGDLTAAPAGRRLSVRELVRVLDPGNWEEKVRREREGSRWRG